MRRRYRIAAAHAGTHAYNRGVCVCVREERERERERERDRERAVLDSLLYLLLYLVRYQYFILPGPLHQLVVSMFFDLMGARFPFSLHNMLAMSSGNSRFPNVLT